VTDLHGTIAMSVTETGKHRVVNAAIARAKQEWECTVDALPQLVCVLDGNRNIVRANRAIETWSLGKVREVQGRAVHRLLHPECDGHGCVLAGKLDAAWTELLRDGASNFEVHDTLLLRVLNVTLRRMSSGALDETRASTHLAVIVLSDITELHNIQADLQRMNDELESRIEARTRELHASPGRAVDALRPADDGAGGRAQTHRAGAARQHRAVIERDQILPRTCGGDDPWEGRRCTAAAPHDHDYARTGDGRVDSFHRDESASLDAR